MCTPQAFAPAAAVVAAGCGDGGGDGQAAHPAQRFFHPHFCRHGSGRVQHQASQGSAGGGGAGGGAAPLRAPLVQLRSKPDPSHTN